MSGSISTPPPALSEASISSRIDRIPLTRKYWALIGMLVLLFTFDVFDLSLFGYAAPSVKAQWGLSTETVGWVASVAFFGMFLGGVVGGRFADRFGRRTMALVGVSTFSLATFISAFAPDITSFTVLRFLTGFFLQTATGAILVLATDSFPKPVRGRAMALMLGFSLIGAPICALSARALIPSHGWQSIYMIGGAGLIIAGALWKFLPESPLWLASRGRLQEADQLVQRYEAAAVSSGVALADPVALPTAVSRPATTGKFTDLFRRSIIARTIVSVLAFSLLIVMLYGFSQWLPLLLVERGMPLDQALTVAFILSFANMAGALLATAVVDRFERKTTITAFAVIAAIAYLMMALIDSMPVLLIAGFVAAAMAQSLSAVIYAYVPEMFPVDIRATGAGTANGTGRLAGAANGIAVGAILAVWSTTGVLVYLVVAALALVVVIAFGPRMGIRESRRQAISPAEPLPAS